jgi:2-polyprenyl-3-methyl-5-hydroxy-6-metoxy-1,4-benzoquinol methylase
MVSDTRIDNEVAHGRLIIRSGEEVWNWSSPAGKIRRQRRVDMFHGFLGNHNRDVLEVGCGTGLFTQEFAKTTNRITAIDISRELVEIARDRVTSQSVTFEIENAYKTTFKANSFDFIIGSSSLHHLELETALKEFHRVLRSGGWLMFTEPNMLNPQICLQKNISWLKRLVGDSPDETAFVRFLLRKKLIKAGFVEIRIIPFDFIHPSIPESMLGKVVAVLNFLEKMPLLREIAGSLAITAKKAER